MFRYMDAMHYAQKASELNPRYGKASFLRAHVYRKQGNTHAAKNELNKMCTAILRDISTDCENVLRKI